MKNFGTNYIGKIVEKYNKSSVLKEYVVISDTSFM